jgi:polar amino acid transport system substrate-binding protein
MKQLFRYAVAVVALAAHVHAPQAATLTFFTEQNPPFNYVENAKLTGSATEIVTLMAGRAGQPVTTEVLPWDTAFVRVQAEKNTCLFATARLENRERLFIWVGPLANNPWALYAKGDFAVPIKTLKDLAPYRIGAVSRDAKGDFLRENSITNLRLVRDDSDNPPRLLLPADSPDHIDLWISGLYSARDIAKKAKVGNVKLVFIAAEQPLYLACNPQTDRATVKALADALQALTADGTVAKINAGYEAKFAQ